MRYLDQIANNVIYYPETERHVFDLYEALCLTSFKQYEKRRKWYGVDIEYEKDHWTLSLEGNRLVTRMTAVSMLHERAFTYITILQKIAFFEQYDFKQKT